MQLNILQSNTKRPHQKRVGRGGKRGTTSGHGTKGQKSRAGASVKPGFRGGDNRIWQLFPKQRGAPHKLKSKRPHRKHRFFRLHQQASQALNLWALNGFEDGTVVTSELLIQKKLAEAGTPIKLLGSGKLERKLTIKGIPCSVSAKAAIEQAGGSVQK